MTTETIHTCSYYCERPECIRRQRDELRDRMESALAGSVPQRYDIDADPNGIRADVTRCVRAALYCGANNVNPPPEGHWLRDFWFIGMAEASRQDALAQQPAAVDEARSVSSIMDGAVAFVEALAAQQQEARNG